MDKLNNPKTFKLLFLIATPLYNKKIYLYKIERNIDVIMFDLEGE